MESSFETTIFLYRSKSNLEKTTSYLQQRSKSNLDSSTVRKLMGGTAGSSGGCSTPPPGRRNVGTPPPHPNLSAAGNQYFLKNTL